MTALWPSDAAGGKATDVAEKTSYLGAGTVLDAGFVLTTKSCFNRHHWKAFILPRLLARRGPGVHDGGGPLEVTISEGRQTLRWPTTNPFPMRAQLRRAGFEVLSFDSEVAPGRGRTRTRRSAHFHRWDHFVACRKRSST